MRPTLARAFSCLARLARHLAWILLELDRSRGVATAIAFAVTAFGLWMCAIPVWDVISTADSAAVGADAVVGLVAFVLSMASAAET